MRCPSSEAVLRTVDSKRRRAIAVAIDAHYGRQLLSALVLHNAMSFLDQFHPPKRPGLRYSDEARLWASRQFAESHQQIAAVVAGILCEQTGAQFSELSAASRFIEEIGVFDFFDTVDYSTAVQQEFQIAMSECDVAEMHRISDLVEFLFVSLARRE
jgi:acyl carrier protein